MRSDFFTASTSKRCASVRTACSILAGRSESGVSAGTTSAMFTTCFRRSLSRRSSTSELSSSSVMSARVKSMALGGSEETTGSKRLRRSSTLKCDSYRAEKTTKSIVASTTNPKEAATSRGRRKSVAARSRSVREKGVCELPFNSADMDRTAKPITPGGLYGNSPDFKDAISKCCHSFLLKLQWVHVPAHGVGRNILAYL